MTTPLPLDGADVPRATYRLQLNAGFRFADAQAIVPYLAALGVGHVYLSPILAAALQLPVFGAVYLAATLALGDAEATASWRRLRARAFGRGGAA